MAQSILIVEDDPAMLKALSESISRAGYAVLGAKDGAQGLTLARESHPDCILLDILMPGTNGLAMMQSLRMDEWGKKVPIIILTNLEANDRMISTILRDKPAYYLLKSDTKLEELTEKIKDVLTTQRA